MSMLYYFLSNKEKQNAYLFQNLKINQHEEMKRYQNQYPVISLSLKDMKYDLFSMQIEYYSILFSRILRQFPEIYRLDVFNQSQFNRYLNHQSSLVELSESLLNLCIALQEYYHQKVILLIDEYDVPLQTAYTYGYYDQMVQFLSHLFGSALKTNTALE